MAVTKSGAGPVLRGVIRLVRAAYGVPQITTTALHKQMKQDKPNRRLVLLDVREPEEYRVSHLPGAVHVAPGEQDMKQLIRKINDKGGDSPKTVVTYCAVGVRASIMARRLMAELDRPYNRYLKSNMDVYNLEGSIFKWVNEERDLQKPSGRPTNVAHPVDKTVWFRLMEPQVRSYGGKSSD